MHRGSSKGGQGNDLPPESLPLSAPPRAAADVVFEVVRAARSQEHRVAVTRGTLLRDALRTAGLAAEGSAVFDGDQPLPLTTPLNESLRLQVVPTFSGG